MISHTRSPGANPVTPAPTASTTPAPSWSGTVSGISVPGSARSPLRAFQSVGLTAETTTRTRTSPGPGSVTARSDSSSTSGPPWRR